MQVIAVSTSFLLGTAVALLLATATLRAVCLVLKPVQLLDATHGLKKKRPGKE